MRRFVFSFNRYILTKACVFFIKVQRTEATSPEGGFSSNPFILKFTMGCHIYRTVSILWAGDFKQWSRSWFIVEKKKR